MNAGKRLIRSLNDSSRPYVDPLARLRWSDLATDTWWLPPQALSLAAVPAFEALPAAMRHRLSQFEFARVLEAGLWLESIFIERFGRASGKEGDGGLRMRYLHEIREEAGHSLMFLELLARSGVHVPDRACARSRAATAAGRLLPFSGALFWTFTVIGEELGDRLTRTIPRGIEEATLSAVVYHMARIHIQDEARHIAHTRAACAEACGRLASWRLRSLSPLVQMAIDRFARLLYYPPSALYAAAGLPSAVDWRGLALASEERRDFTAEAIQPTLAFLRTIGWTLRTTGA